MRVRPPAEGGSVLMLMPAAVLVFIVLGAIAVDFAAVFLGEREVANAAASAANDAASEAVDREGFYATATVRLDPAVAARVAARSVAAAGLADHLDEIVVTTRVTAGLPEVTVTVRARVRHLFTSAVPGGPESTAVEATAIVTAQQE
jgi:Flp pilus assembly protein TadG